jgi:pimeloyl-ACP methyl ester carboxylesterase
MILDTTVHKGSKDRPVVILIHGLGMDKNFWIDPFSTRIFAKNIPLGLFTATRPAPCRKVEGGRITLGSFDYGVDSLWKELKDDGFSLICWSQKRPVGPIDFATEELSLVVRMAKRLFPKIPLALVGHSRGGLIARKFMETKRRGIRALITISTPHGGSSIAKVGKYLEPFSAMLKRVSPENDYNVISRTVKNVKNLIEGKAWEEMMPDSTFFKNLKDKYQEDVLYVSLGGSQPRLFTVYVWRKMREKMYAMPLMTVPDSLMKVIPNFLSLDEITPGRGDGLVSAESSALPWSSAHHVLKANHVSIIWNKKVKRIVIETLGRL